jgi:hypothetical protein
VRFLAADCRRLLNTVPHFVIITFSFLVLISFSLLVLMALTNVNDRTTGSKFYMITMEANSHPCFSASK